LSCIGGTGRLDVLVLTFFARGRGETFSNNGLILSFGRGSPLTSAVRTMACISVSIPCIACICCCCAQTSCHIIRSPSLKVALSVVGNVVVPGTGKGIGNGTDGSGSCGTD
jgi:hypothetical protein